MTTWYKRIYRLWQQRHPEFNAADYARWVQQRGYYNSALDPSKPAFYEYATLYVNLHAQRRLH